MDKPRTLMTTLAMVFVTALVVALMIVLWLVGQDLLQVKQARTELSSGLQQVQKSVSNLDAQAKDVRDSLAQVKAEQARLAAEVKKASDALDGLQTDLASLRARLKAIELPPAPRLTVGLTPPKGAEGIGPALGLDPETRAKVEAAHAEFMPRVYAAEKAHAKVSIEGDSVRIEIAPFHEDGQRLLAEWQKVLADILTPQQLDAYKRMRLDTMAFRPGLGDHYQVILVSRDGMGLKFEQRGRGVGPGTATFESAGTVSGANALDRLRWRHLLTDEAIAKLRGVAQP